MTPKDIAASIRARLLNISRETQEDFQMLLNRYARERLLYRLSQSPLRDRFVLKGATLFSVWVEKPFRSTRDADFLSFGPNDVDSVTRGFRDLCGSDGGNDPDDGIRFDRESVQGAQIREEEEYSGVRILLDAYIGRAKARIQIDIGFGDAITPEAQEVTLPAILDLPAPRLRAYPKETVIAEKFQAMAVLAETNSRMKDFYDIWVMQSQFVFEGAQLAEAIKTTFARRRTDVVPSSCVAFQSAFYSSKEPLIHWRLYVQRGSFERIPPTFAEVGETIDAFLRPIAESIARGEPFDRTWPPGGPWKTTLKKK
jgi:predicted nucleotidyltransferase component of viral defense system